ncbi:MAG: YbjN domain-containing protein [Hyphomonadaceae bacterium]
MRLFGLLPLMLVACSPTVEAPKAAVEEPAAQAQLVDVFDAAQIIRLVAPMDCTPTAQVAQSSEANASIDFKGPDGETWRVEARHCASHTPGVKCEGITLTARVKVPRSTPAQMLTYANTFNQDQAAVFMFEDAGDLVVSDDIVLDGGISEQNLEAQLAAFSTVLRQNRDFLLRAAGVIE